LTIKSAQHTISPRHSIVSKSLEIKPEWLGFNRKLINSNRELPFRRSALL